MSETKADRRLELRKSVIAAVNELYQHGLITPTGGNISVRCPEGGNILITASQIFKGDLGPEHVLEVDAKGNVVPSPEEEKTVLGWTPDAPPLSAPRPRPSVETGMHLAIYATRPDVGAVVHTHAPLATAWGLFDEPIAPLTLDHIRFTETRVVPFSPPGSNELASSTAEALVRGPAALLRNHGLVTVGLDLRQAISTALALEESLKISFAARLGQLAGLAGGGPAVIPARAAEFLKKILVG